jgi:guanylate kinase
MNKQEFLEQAKALQGEYVLSPAVRQKLAKVRVVALVGPTGVGKTTIMNGVGLPVAISDVTREARNGEKNGSDYNFRKDFQKILEELQGGEFVQFTVILGEFYGTRAETYPDEGVCILSAAASALPFLRKLGFAQVIPVYVIPPSYEEWVARFEKHGDQNMPERMQEAKQSLSIALHDEEFIFLLNDNLEYAKEQFKRIVDGSYAPIESEKASKAAAALFDRVMKG